jgi:hypothetical protein
MSRSIYTRE